VVVFQLGGFQDGINIDHELGPLVSQAERLKKFRSFILTGERWSVECATSRANPPLRCKVWTT
jgi:hypothetical protein